MTESQNNNELKIIKARVEQDKYAAVELKIIKANGSSVLKDLYVEKEVEANSLFVASDNVLVTLHRELKPGMFPNFQLITNKGELVLQPEYKEIRLENSDLLVAVKTNSDMISVKNNQVLRSDPAKIQEILHDSKNIKDQMVGTMKGTNPNNRGDLRFLYEDACEEAILYRLKKDNDKYSVEALADKISFVAVDDDYIYTHSNIVPDLTKAIRIRPEENVVQESLNVVSEQPAGFVEHNVDTFVNEEKVDVVNSNDNVVDVPVMVNNNTLSDNVLGVEAVPSASTSILNNVSVEAPVVPDYKSDIVEKEESVVNMPTYSNKFFDGVEPVSNIMNIKEEEESVEESNATTETSSGHSQVFDEFFGVNEEDSSLKHIDIGYDHSGSDRYEQLSEMISKVISAEKSSKDRIIDYEEKIRDLEAELSKLSAENESKMKKVSILINQNRQLGDDNRALKNRVSGLENKTLRLEEENKRYLKENRELKAEAKSRESKLTAMISSVSDLLGSYNDMDASYAIKKKVA